MALEYIRALLSVLFASVSSEIYANIVAGPPPCVLACCLYHVPTVAHKMIDSAANPWVNSKQQTSGLEGFDWNDPGNICFVLLKVPGWLRTAIVCSGSVGSYMLNINIRLGSSPRLASLLSHFYYNEKNWPHIRENPTIHNRLDISGKHM